MSLKRNVLVAFACILACLLWGCSFSNGEKDVAKNEISVGVATIEPSSVPADWDILSSVYITELSPYDKTVYDLCTQTYSDEELEKIIALRCDYSSLDEQYPVECIREEPYGYRVVYLGNEKIANLRLDMDGNILLGNIIGISLSLNDYLRIGVGQNRTAVVSLDPNGYYPWKMFSGIQPQFSEHYTTDGYYVYYVYDRAWNIHAVTFERA